MPAGVGTIVIAFSALAVLILARGPLTPRNRHPLRSLHLQQPKFQRRWEDSTWRSTRTYSTSS